MDDGAISPVDDSLADEDGKTPVDETAVEEPPVEDGEEEDDKTLVEEALRSFSHRVPLNKAAHAHTNPLTRSEHVPPFRQGLELHSSTLIVQLKPARPGGQGTQEVLPIPF